MREGIIVKALSGFYYVQCGDGLLECKARGRFRLDGTSPLVGDRVRCSLDASGKGRIDQVLPRSNWFIRPAVANIDELVFVASGTNPITDPFLIDRVSALAVDLSVYQDELDYEALAAAGVTTCMLRVGFRGY